MDTTYTGVICNIDIEMMHIHEKLLQRMLKLLLDNLLTKRGRTWSDVVLSKYANGETVVPVERMP